MKTLPLNLTSRVVKPVRLVVIERRDGPIIRIAEAQSSVTVDGDIFYPIAGVEISAVTHKLGGDVPSMEIRAAHSVGGTFDTVTIDKGLFDSAVVNLFIADRSNPTTLGLLFTGTIQPIAYDSSGWVTFDVRGHAVAAATGFIQKFSPMCRTDLYSPLCTVNPASFDYAATVGTIINRFNFSVVIGSPPAAGWFNQGVCVTDAGVAFEIANYASDIITAYLPSHRFITAGQGLTLYPGCDKRIGTCHSKFNNALNFQGEPHSIGIYAATTTSGG